MSESPILLRNFSGFPELTSSAHQLKADALKLCEAIRKIENEGEQDAAVQALRELKSIRIGVEATKKAIKAPVTKLSKDIDNLSNTFLQDVLAAELRLQGLINHFQNKQFERKRDEDERARKALEEAQKIRDEADLKKASGEDASDLESREIDLRMEAELSSSDSSLVTSKPKGLVVRHRLDFEIKDPIIVAQAFPDLWKWDPKNETLKLKRREILEELNRPDGKGIFHSTRFPEEVPDLENIPSPAGIRVFKDTSSHVR